jgi:hypothetical protein
MATANPILSDMQARLRENRRNFEVLIVYRCVHFLCKATLEGLNGDNMVLTVQPPASVLLVEKRHAIVLGDRLFDPIKASIVSFDLITGRLELQGYTYAGHIIGSRHENRVEPESPMKVEIETEGGGLKAELADLSLNGAGILVPALRPGALLKRGQNLLLQLNLPEGNFKIPAMVRGSEQKADSCRVAVEFTQNVPGKTLIFRYITRRLAEIQQEVQNLYQETYQACLRERHKAES